MKVSEVMFQLGIVTAILIFLFFADLSALNEEWDQLLDLPVIDVVFTNNPGIHADGLAMLIPGDNGGLAYYTTTDSLTVFQFIHPQLHLVSIAADDQNNRIFCLTGGYSNSDGLYYFDVNTEEYGLVSFVNGGNFIKKLSSGFYLGWGTEFGQGGLLHSLDGYQWTEMTDFDSYHVYKIVETGDGTLFVATWEGIFIVESGREKPSQILELENITDLFVRSHPYSDEVYFALGLGSWSDGVYRIEYGDGEISNVIPINYIYLAKRLYEYDNYLVVGAYDNLSNLFLVEPSFLGEIYPIGSELGIDDVFCFERLPVYTPNFVVGTDNGLFWGRNIFVEITAPVVVNNSVKLAQNYPNPFNPATIIDFVLTHPGYTRLAIYNLQGQRIKTITARFLDRGEHSVVWQGDDDLGNRVASGVYFYQLEIDGEISAIRKCLYLK
jgi:hypothetical protein